MSIVNGHARWAYDFRAWKPTMHDLKIAVSLIQPEEKKRLSKFMFQEDFKASLCGRLLMRYFVRNAMSINNHQFKLGRDLKQKPYLKEINCATNWEEKIIEFNVSHQGSLACLAGYVSDKTEINTSTKLGVDVMKIEYSGGKSLSEFFRLMTRNFSDNEWKQIKTFDTNIGKLEAFMRNWCLKESYVKATGTGLTEDLRKLNFIIKTSRMEENEVITDTKLESDGKTLENYHFEESLLGKEHCVAVCFHNHRPSTDFLPPLPFKLIQFEELIENATPLSEVDEIYCAEILKKDTKT
ncbi:CLUMA_CG019635, isoform A [Clunio marinus]|uniref:L-aminoadipate-semialdehyde dehydrogenase-phosphopantetheinyl transferase n=1 Tax=Clunio marinus TaxID=568069 RepID=A0A1J1J3B6_9DIPT|nr:CLUMA_CG019635, isoform A [Clunio marinus]